MRNIFNIWLFYNILPLSLKILLNLYMYLLSSKQETTYKNINIKKKSSDSSRGFLSL